MLICIDAGHGGSDSGCSGFGKLEKMLTLEYATMLKNELLKYKDVSVIMTRTNDVALDLTTRCNIANTNKADLFVSCHLNAFNGEARGTEVIYSVNSNQSFVDFCNYLGREMAKDLGIPFRRAFSRKATKGSSDYYTVIAKTKMKAIIVEGLFLDNREDNVRYNPYTLAKSIARCIASHYCLQLKQDNTTVYKNGCKGENIKVLQQKINDYFDSLKINIDGDFGSKTEKAIKIYQKINDLEVDGIVGPMTQKILGI